MHNGCDNLVVVYAWFQLHFHFYAALLDKLSYYACHMISYVISL